MATGQPFASPKATTSSAEVRNSVVPGTPATPAALGRQPRRHLVAHDLDRLGRRADERDAPSVMARAKSVFSEKNPYPGWTASAP